MEFCDQFAYFEAYVLSFVFTDFVEEQFDLFTFYELHDDSCVFDVNKEYCWSWNACFFRSAHQLRFVYGSVRSNLMVKFYRSVLFGQTFLQNCFSAMPLSKVEVGFGALLDQRSRVYFIHGISTSSTRHLSFTKLFSIGVTVWLV